MDFNHLENLILSLQTRPQKIKALVDYILLNGSSNEQQVAVALQKAFNSYNLDKKLAVFYSISEILLITGQKRELSYFKVFGSKLKPFLQVLAAQVKDIRVMKDICRTLDKWQSQQIFIGNFMERLKGAAKQLYQKVREESNQQQRSLAFKKYKKTFLMEINDLRNYQTSYQVYQNYCQYMQIEQKLTNLNLEYNKIDFDKKSENSEINRRRCEQLNKMYNDLREKLENAIIKIQRSFNKMRQWATQEMEMLKRESTSSTQIRRTSSNNLL